MKGKEGLRKVVFGMEPTGNYHKPWGEYLIRCGHEVVLVCGVTAQALAHVAAYYERKEGLRT